MSFLQEALEQARLGQKLGEVPVGAIIVCENKIIASAHNSREMQKNPVGHAEVTVLQAAAKALGDWRLNSHDLYVTLEPCIMCLAACQLARVRKIYYGAPDAKAGALSLGYQIHCDARLNHYIEIEYLSADQSSGECGKILTDFFRSKRSKRTV